ncbi:MAG: hypothetical protein J6R44_02550 [Clostridia bacterium]|nr:hypothetical protein [Clostridia bacterium]
MANNIYEKIVYQINNLIKQEDIYPKYMDSISGGKNDFKISQVYTKKNYDNSWIGTIEDCIVSLDNIVRNPRKFIVIEEDIVDISLARSISVESVKHLSQHTNLISSVDKNGMVIPSKILNTSKEESFDIYENRFIYTLLLKVRDFIERRFTEIQSALLRSGEIDIAVESEFAINKNKVKYKIDGSANFPFDAVVKKKGEGLTDVERITHIKSIISDFLASPFSKEMRSCALVRPPILRTNVILKNPDFKKALVLWQFIESTEKMDFTIDSVTETQDMAPALADKYRGLIFLNTVLMQSIATTRTDEEVFEGKEEEKKTEADEYRTKNIDDFVPDDFPHLKMELSEIRRVYRKLIAGEPTLTNGEMSKLNGALDRVIRQYKINKAKEDSYRQQQLILKQLEEEKIAKRLALREQKDLERKARAEEARRRIQLRKEEAEHKLRLKKLEVQAKLEEKRLEKESRQRLKDEQERQKLELIRLEKERAELEARRQEGRTRLLELRDIQDKRMAEERRISEREDEQMRLLHEQYSIKEGIAREKLFYAKEQYELALKKFKEEEDALEAERRAHVNKMAEAKSERVKKEEEARTLERLAKEKEQSAKDVDEQKVVTLKKMREDSDFYWEEEQRLATDLAIKLKLDVLRRYENEETKAIITMREDAIRAIKSLESAFNARATAEEMLAVDTLMAIARKNMTEEEILSVMKDFDKNMRTRSRERRFMKIKERFSKKK